MDATIKGVSIKGVKGVIVSPKIDRRGGVVACFTACFCFYSLFISRLKRTAPGHQQPLGQRGGFLRLPRLLEGLLRMLDATLRHWDCWVGLD